MLEREGNGAVASHSHLEEHRHSACVTPSRCEDDAVARGPAQGPVIARNEREKRGKGRTGLLTRPDSSAPLASFEGVGNLGGGAAAAQQDLGVPQLAAPGVVEGARDEPGPRAARAVGRQRLADDAVRRRRGQLDGRIQNSQADVQCAWAGRGLAERLVAEGTGGSRAETGSYSANGKLEEPGESDTGKAAGKERAKGCRRARHTLYTAWVLHRPSAGLTSLRRRRGRRAE